MSYLTRVSAWLSQGINCVLLNGSPDQTVSARAYINQKEKYWGIAYKWINKLFFWQGNHCKASYQVDINFAKSILKLK